MRFEIKGLVLRETPVGDNAAYIDVLTAERGRISVFARGVRSYRSKNRGATLPLCFSEFTLDRQKPDFTVLCEAKTVESYGVENDLECSALGMYVLEILREFALPDTPQEALLRLGLNTLYAVRGRRYPLPLVKAAFELRVMADEGYAPELSGCADCGRDDTDDMYLDIMNGALRCAACLDKHPADAAHAPSEGTATILVPVSRGTVAAMRYVVGAPAARIFSFKLEERCVPELDVASEKYVVNHLERSFPTLDFYKQVVTLCEAQRRSENEKQEKEKEKDSNG